MRLWLTGRAPILDPMAGVGTLVMPVDSGLIYNEIEHEWAEQCPGPTVVSDAKRLPFADHTFEAAVTSPVYGNRMSDHHDAKDGSRRITYKHLLGRDLHKANTGQMQWGADYRGHHICIWTELHRVLKPSGVFVLNISDHVRQGTVMPVTAWHRSILEQIGFRVTGEVLIPTKRMRFGENHGARVDHEVLYRFEKL